MELSDENKMMFIRTTLQVDNVITLLTNISKADLIKTIELTPENAKNEFYDLLPLALDFYNKIEKAAKENDELQNSRAHCGLAKQ